MKAPGADSSVTAVSDELTVTRFFAKRCLGAGGLPCEPQEPRLTERGIKVHPSY